MTELRFNESNQRKDDASAYIPPVKMCFVPAVLCLERDRIVHHVQAVKANSDVRNLHEVQYQKVYDLLLKDFSPHVSIHTFIFDGETIIKGNYSKCIKSRSCIDDSNVCCDVIPVVVHAEIESRTTLESVDQIFSSVIYYDRSLGVLKYNVDAVKNNECQDQYAYFDRLNYSL